MSLPDRSHFKRIAPLSRDQLENLVSHGEQQLTRILRCGEMLRALPMSPRLLQRLAENARLVDSVRAQIDDLRAELFAPDAGSLVG